jgi:AraC-like DNA-binding protein
MHDAHARSSEAPALASGPGSLLARSSRKDDETSDTAERQRVDVLSDALRAIRLTGASFFLVDASAPWVAEAPAGSMLAPVLLPHAQHVISYHVIAQGGCWGGLVGEAPVWLDTGDVLVLPHGDPYVLSTAPGMRSDVPLDLALDFFRQMAARELPLVVTEGGGNPGGVNVVCGFLACDALPMNPVIATLPRLLHVRRSGSPANDRLTQLTEYAVAESRDNRAGCESVLLKIGELVFLEVVRRYLASLSAEETGWLAALRDRAVGHALALMHEQPAHPWTLEKLASDVGRSRSALAERFTHLVGQPPMQYLTRWRMQLAASRLAASQVKVSALALELGYESEAAFSRAFKKLAGVSPSSWRKR